MKTQRDKLQQYQRKIKTITARETEIARACLAQNNKAGALLALRKKKFQESLLQKTDEQLAQLEQLVNDVEFATIQKDVVFGLQQGTEVLKQIHKEMGGVEGVERLLGESEDARIVQKVSSNPKGLVI
jgi:charged multivesicular body protein 6